MSNGPSRAFLTSLHPSGEDDSDVTVLAMTAEQCRDRGQRELLIGRALSALKPDGIIWIEVPGPWRSSIISALRARGMAIGALSVRRAQGATQMQFALTSRSLRFALSRGHLSTRWRPILALLEWAPFGRALLTRLLPGLGFAAYRAGTRPFAWLTKLLPKDEEVGIAVTTNWRGEQAPYLVFALGSDQVLVAKRGGAEARAQIEHEAAMLKALAPSLQRCGLAVPRLIDLAAGSTLSTLIESDVPGRPLAGLIREGHHRELGKIAHHLAEWLTCWNNRSLRHVELTPQLAEELILSAARALVGSIDGGSAYLRWLSRETNQLMGSKVPLVAAHNDLTMANVLADAAAVRSIVDWEAASIDGLPLTDFRYAACDAAALIAGADRLAGFRACFLDGGEHRLRLQQCEGPLRAVAGGPPEWLELCVHAGWLRHAANEQARPSPRDGSFIAIAQLLAQSVS